MSNLIYTSKCYFDAYYSVVIEDNGRVAYAYLMEGEDCIGDVWLYNCLEAPTDTNWDDQELPYLNPVEYIDKKLKLSPIKDKSEIRCDWSESPNDASIEVSIIVRDSFIAQMTSGSKPGWSVLVIKDGPLAQVY